MDPPTGRPAPDATTTGLGRAAAAGLGVALVVALVMALLGAIFDLAAGLLAVAAFGGWLIGGAVRSTAGPASTPRTRSVVGAACGVLAWVAGLLGTWVMSQAILQGSSRSLPERLAATPFLDWLGPQLGLLDVMDLVLLVGVAWLSARGTRQV